MIDTTKTIREVRYNGTAIPLLGGVDNPIVVTSDAEMETCLNDDRYLGMYVKFSGESENYLNGQVYKIAQEGEVSKFYQLPTLDNEGTAADLAVGKQLIGSDGRIVIGAAESGSGNSELLASICNKTITELKASDLKDVTVILDSLFWQCNNLTKVELPDTVISISGYAFSECVNLIDITIPNSVTNIDGNAFYGCESLREIIIPNSITEINSSVFQNCSSLVKVTIPEGIIGINFSAFDGCSSLVNVTIPSSVTSINGMAFSNCNNLTNIILLPTTPPTLGGNAFMNISANAVFTVPRGSLSAYQTATNWSQYADKMVEASN